MPEGDIILSAGKLVGAGDHFIYSTLAKRFTEIGRKVYLYRVTCARNNDTLDMVWGRNPYIVGTTDRAPNAGYVRQGLFYEVANRLPIGSIAAMEMAHGLPPPYSIAPYINYKPKKFPFELQDTVLVDFSAVSSKIGEQGIGEFLRAMKGRFRNAPFLQLIPPKNISLHPPQIACPSVQINGIAEYMDALSGCRAWIGSEAGGQSFAATVRGEHTVYDLEARPEIVVLSTMKTYNSRGYCYAGADYRSTIFGEDKTGDYFFPGEMERHIYDIRCEWSLEQMRSDNPQSWKAVV
ncbi:MAG: hypothetical protein ABR949_10335 [Candidatus Aquilonibacter sp.]